MRGCAHPARCTGSAGAVTATTAQVSGGAVLPPGVRVEADGRALAAAFASLSALQPVRWEAAGLVCSPRCAPELAGPALARCPLPVRVLDAVPGWPTPPAAHVAGWYRRSPDHAPAPAGVRELVQAPGEGFGPGDHATTEMCLEVIDSLPAGAAVRRRLRLGPSGPGLGRARARGGHRLRPRPARG